MKMRKILSVLVVLVGVLLSCNLPTAEKNQSNTQDINITGTTSSPPPANVEPTPIRVLSTEVIRPEQLAYLGSFRLPDIEEEPNWNYSGHGLTYYPGGDPQGADDGFPGSLFGVGHDHYLAVSEISIPVPVDTPNLEEMNTAQTLQPFADITGGLITEDLAIPRLGLEYLPPQGDQNTGKLHWCWGQHIQDFQPSHGWSEIDLSNPQPTGDWVFNGYTNYVTNDYIFEIPPAWASEIGGDQRLASGRAREGLWSGRGPALFAYAPWQDGNPPSGNSVLDTVTPLLLYGEQLPGQPDIVSDEGMAVDNYLESDHWMGGAWLTHADQAAVIFVGTKAVGRDWYGFANGVEWPHDCSDQDPPTCPDVPEWPNDSRGFWAEDYQAQIIFYDPADLAAVSRGELETYEPQPYAVLDLTPFLIDPRIDPGRYKRDLVGAAAFDRERGYLFIFERLADEDRSIIHVFAIQD